MIDKYMVIESWNKEHLEQKVNDAIERGWDPKGGICVCIAPERNTFYYSQAMVMGVS